MAVAKNKGAASCSNTNVIFWWRCETANFSATNGTLDYSAGDDTATLSNGAVLHADAKKNGTLGLDFPGTYDMALFGTPSATLDDEGRIGIWKRFETFTDTRVLYKFYYSGSTDAVIFRLDGTEELEVYWEDSNTVRDLLTSSGAGLVANGTTWYFIEFAWKVGTSPNGYREIFVNGVSVGSSTATIASFQAAVLYHRFGDDSGIAQDMHMDHAIISSDSTHNLYLCRDQLNYDGS